MVQHCEYKTDIPKTDHYAILQFVTINIPCRADGGRGTGSAPAETEHVTRYFSYTDKVEWEKAIAAFLDGPDAKLYIPLVVKVPTVKRTITVEVSI